MKKIIIAIILLLAPFFASASIDKNLSYGMKNDSDVMELQEFLTVDGCYNGLTRGNFLSLTLKGVKCFQTKHHDEISALAGYFIKSSGFVGSGTRTFINQKLEEELADSNAEAAQEGTTPCTPYWQCSNWSTCIGSQQTRSCTDSNNCNVITGKPSETQGCTITCSPSWQCNSWSTCLNSVQTRTCSDTNSCGVANGEPSETRVCANACTPNWRCFSWGFCTNSQQTRTCSDSNSCGVTVGKPVEIQSCCISNWQCGTWNGCANSQQTRTCTDSNNCGVTTGKPTELQSCVIGALYIATDPTSPRSDFIIGGDTVILGVFKLTATSVESLDVDDITFSVVGGNSVETYYLYNSTTLLGSAASGIAPKFNLANGILTVPANGYVRVTLNAKLAKENIVNNTTITASLDAYPAVNTTGLSSGGKVDSSNRTAIASGMDLYKTKPTFAVNPSCHPYNNPLIPSSAELIAIFDVTANANGDVTFEKDICKLVFNVYRSQGDYDGVANTWLLKDSNGNILDTASVADNDETVTFDFTNAALTVSAGTTKSLFIYADTTELEDGGDAIQLILNGWDPNNITWSINNDGQLYHDADKIFPGYSDIVFPRYYR